MVAIICLSEKSAVCCWLKKVYPLSSVILRVILFSTDDISGCLATIYPEHSPICKLKFAFLWSLRKRIRAQEKKSFLLFHPLIWNSASLAISHWPAGRPCANSCQSLSAHWYITNFFFQSWQIQSMSGGAGYEQSSNMATAQFSVNPEVSWPRIP